MSKRCVRHAEPKRNGLLINDRDLLHILEIRRVLRSVFRVHDRLDRKLHVVRRKRLPVVPRHAVTQIKRVCVCIRVVIPSLGKRRYDLIVPVMRRQTVKNQEIDFPVLIQRRIDARVIAAAVNERRRRTFSLIILPICAGLLPVCRWRTLSGVSSATPRKHRQHRSRQQKR